MAGLSGGRTGGVSRRTVTSIVDVVSIWTDLSIITKHKQRRTRVGSTCTYTKGNEGGGTEGQGDDELDVCVLLARLDKLVAAAITAALLALVRVVEVHDGWLSVWLLIRGCGQQQQRKRQRGKIMGDKGDDGHANIVVSSRVASEREEPSQVEPGGIGRYPASQGQSTKILVNSSSSVAAPLVSFPPGSLAHRLSGPSRVPSVALHA